MTRQVGNEIDEFVTEALRNNLLGLPLDLADHQPGARPRHRRADAEPGARAILRMTGDSQLKPYASWADFVQHMKHPESLVNFIAAYGTHASHHRRDDTRGQARRRLCPGLRRRRVRRRSARRSSDDATVAVPADRLAFLNGARGDDRRRRHRPVDRRPGREADAVRRPARLDLQLRVREPDGEAAERRPLLLPGAHRGAQLPHRAREQLVRQADHGEHRRDAPARRRVLDAGLHPGSRPEPAVHRPRARRARRSDRRRRLHDRRSATTPAPPARTPNYLQYTRRGPCRARRHGRQRHPHRQHRRRHALRRRRQRPARGRRTATT